MRCFTEQFLATIERRFAMQVVGEPIKFIETSFALRIVAKNLPLGHHIKWFSAFDVIIRKVY